MVHRYRLLLNARAAGSDLLLQDLSVTLGAGEFTANTKSPG